MGKKRLSVLGFLLFCLFIISSITLFPVAHELSAVVSEQTPTNSYSGNGSATTFAYTFKVFKNTDLLVKVDGVAKTLTTDYTVTGVGVSGGGTVVFVTAPVNGSAIAISRNMKYERTTDYAEHGDLRAQTLDDDIDSTVMLIQQMKQRYDTDEVTTARGSKSTLDGRLDVSMNEDGTLRASTSLNPSQWVKPSFTFTYVSTTSFKVTGDQTDIYTTYRRLKINLTGSTVYSEVVSSGYAVGETTVVIFDAVLTTSLIDIEHSIISPVGLTNQSALSPQAIGIDEIEVSKYASLTAAVTAIGASADTTLLINSSTAVTANTTVTANIRLLFTNKGMITKTSGTLTINGLLETGTYQIFSGFSAGDVTFGVGAVQEVHPEWWGAIADGSTDNINAITATIASSNAPRVIFGRGVYTFTGPINLNKSGIVFEGTSAPARSTIVGTRLHNIGGAGLDALYIGTNIYKVMVKNMQITGTSASRYGIHINNVIYPVIEDVIVGNYTGTDGYGHGSDGIYITSNTYYASLNRVTSRNNYGKGLSIVATSNATYITDSHIQCNAGDGIRVDDSYGIYGKNLDISANGSGAVDCVGGGVAAYGLVIEGTSHGTSWENVNYEINGNSNKVRQNVDSGAYRNHNYYNWVGDNIYWDIIAGNHTTIHKTVGSSQVIVWGAGTSWSVAMDVDDTATITGYYLGMNDNYTIDSSIGNSYNSIASNTELNLSNAAVQLVTGTTNITSIATAATKRGRRITLIFEGTLTFTDGNNLKLAGSFVTSAGDTITLVSDGTNWFEVSRSAN